jgi:hypothetical protein
MTRSRDTASIIPTVDAKGDLLVGTADNTIDNLPAGTNGTYLKANSASATGLEWATGVESIVDAKGDLLVGTADNTIDNLSPGTNGQVLTANSATTTGLEWTTPASTGNAIINGAFEINQRNFTSSTVDSTYGFDRWFFTQSNGTATQSAQTFTPGAAPIAEIEAANFLRIVTTGQTLSSSVVSLQHRIEDVRTFAGQTATISFYAKAGSGAPKLALEMGQQFGSGGSAAVITYVGQASLSTSWQRFSLTVALPSISGKTIGTSSFLNCLFWISAGSDRDARTGSLGNQNNTFDIWGVQVEAGPVATPFRRNANSLQAELAACQRYYFRSSHATSGETFFGYAALRGGSSTTMGLMHLPVEMRVVPTITMSGIQVKFFNGGAQAVTNTVLYNGSNRQSAFFEFNRSGTWPADGSAFLNGSSGSFIDFSAEF